MSGTKTHRVLFCLMQLELIAKTQGLLFSNLLSVPKGVRGRRSLCIAFPLFSTPVFLRLYHLVGSSVVFLSILKHFNISFSFVSFFLLLQFVSSPKFALSSLGVCSHLIYSTFLSFLYHLYLFLISLTVMYYVLHEKSTN